MDYYKNGRWIFPFKKFSRFSQRPCIKTFSLIIFVLWNIPYCPILIYSRSGIWTTSVYFDYQCDITYTTHCITCIIAVHFTENISKSRQLDKRIEAAGKLSDYNGFGGKQSGYGVREASRLARGNIFYDFLKNILTFYYAFLSSKYIFPCDFLPATKTEILS